MTRCSLFMNVSVDPFGNRDDEREAEEEQEEVAEEEVFSLLVLSLKTHLLSHLLNLPIGHSAESHLSRTPTQANPATRTKCKGSCIN